MRRAVFFDRDDTLIANAAVTSGTDHPGDLFDPALVHLLPAAAAACRTLHDAGFLLVMVTNQGAVARGRCTLADVDRCNAVLRAQLRRDAAVDLDAVYICPYHPSGVVPPFNTEHIYRKPAPGMLLAAAADLDINLHTSWMVGDAQRDVLAGMRAGIPPERSLRVGSPALPGLAEAAAFIIARSQS